MGEYRVLFGGSSSQWWASLAAAFAGKMIFEVVGCVGAADLLGTAARLYPEIVLWKLGGEDPVPVIRELKARCPFTLPVVLVRDPQQVDLWGLLRAGVRGCVPLRLLPCQIVHTLELIVIGGVLCLPRLGPEFFGSIRVEAEPNALHSLTRREREVLNHMGKNLTNQEIAQVLFLSESTVKTHLRSIFRKLGVRNRAEALVVSLQLGVA